MVIEEVTQLVTIVENGKRKRIPKFRAMVRQAIDKAVVGDFKAFQQILSMVRAHDALKGVVTRKPVVPAIHKGMSPSEAALAYQATLTETFDEENERRYRRQLARRVPRSPTKSASSSTPPPIGSSSPCATPSRSRTILSPVHPMVILRLVVEVDSGEQNALLAPRNCRWSG